MIASRLHVAPDPEIAAGKGAARHRSSVLGRGRPVRYRPPYLPRQPCRRPTTGPTPGAHRRLDACQGCSIGPRPAVGVLCLRRHEGQRDRASIPRCTTPASTGGAGAALTNMIYDVTADTETGRAADGAGRSGQEPRDKIAANPRRFLSAALGVSRSMPRRPPRASTCRARGKSDLGSILFDNAMFPDRKRGEHSPAAFRRCSKVSPR